MSSFEFWGKNTNYEHIFVIIIIWSPIALLLKSCPNFDSSPLHQFSKFNHFLWVKTGRVKSSQFYIQKIEWWKIRNHFFFTCILLDYVAYEVTKDFWKNIHFENKDLFIKHFMNKSLWQLVFFWGFKTHFVIEILIQGRKNCL